MNKEYYINMKEVMARLLPKPTPKPTIDIPIISVEVGLWSNVTW